MPFTDDDATIARALDDVSLPALLMSVVHMTGDLSWIDGPYRPRGGGLLSVQGGLSADEQAALRAEAVAVIAAYRDGACVLPPQPDRAQAIAMMRALVNSDIGDEYEDMVLEELHLDGSDPGEVALGSTARERAALPVIVIGCGESGLLAGIRLLEAGIPFTIIEKNACVGGTWYENRYPGCRVDIPNHFYSYSFETNDHWEEFFSRQPALEAYLQGVMERFDIEPHVRWNTEVVEAEWDARNATWTVTVRSMDGATEQLTSRAVIAAVGQLNRPSVPTSPARTRSSDRRSTPHAGTLRSSSATRVSP